MIGEGMKVRFVPAFAPKADWYMPTRDGEYVTGTITYINWEHKHFVAEFDCGDSKQRESFKFSEIGERVSVIG